MLEWGARFAVLVTLIPIMVPARIVTRVTK